MDDRVAGRAIIACWTAKMDDDDNTASPSTAQLDWRELIGTNTRKWNSFWYWREKPIMESGAALALLEAANIRVEQLVSREPGQDPPDCEALLDGRWSGIEVTELVHQRALEISLKARKQRAAGIEPDRPEVYFNWGRDHLLAALQRLLHAKDRPEKVKGGPYDRYALVIFTDEFFLDRSTVSRFLEGAVFDTIMITDAILGLSYEPSGGVERGSCPTFRLPLAPRRAAP